MGEITHEYVNQWALRDILFCEIPLQRSPVQYDKNEYDLFLNEIMTAAKTCVNYGIIIAMTDKELQQKKYNIYFKNKDKNFDFYKTRYGKDAADMVSKIFDIRKNYGKYKKSKQKIEELFETTLVLMGILKGKIFT